MRIHLKNTIVAALLLTLFSFSMLSVRAQEREQSTESTAQENRQHEQLQNERDTQLKRRIDITNEDRIPASLKAVLRRVEAR